MEASEGSAETRVSKDAFRRYVVPELPVLLRVARRMTGDSANAEEQVLDGVLDAELVAGLRALSDNHREVVLLVDVDGLSYQETADVLGVPTGTVMSRLHRARQRLRKRLERRGYQLGAGR